MKYPRETIYNALATVLMGATGIVHLYRKAVMWNEIPAQLKPALILPSGREDQIKGDRGMPYLWHIFVDAYLYVDVGDCRDVTPQAIISPYLDAIETAIQPIPPYQTLGGLVSEVRIFGTILRDDGVLGPQGVAMIPFRIVTT